MATDDMDVHNIPGPGTFQFSGIRPENLGATEYTLVTVVVDRTGSIQGFEGDLLKMVKNIVDACSKSPRADNLMLRLVTFNEDVTEEHGFKPLNTIQASDYKGFVPEGMTALYDATFSSIAATIQYAQTLVDQDFDVNGAVYIITDGMDNRSKTSPKMIAKEVSKVIKDETGIESLITVLIGVNAGDCKGYLEHFKLEGGLTQFVDVGSATPQKLAKLAAFVSKSISSQSQALGTGAPSQSLSF
jgi:uncharacterized protein YegL